MPKRRLVLRGDVPAPLEAGLARLADRLDLPDEFPPGAQAEARGAVQAGPAARADRQDLTEVPFVTIDPPGSMDLDQALFLETMDDGYRVWYAIADVAAWVRPGGALDAEAARRGQTYYAPTVRLPLYPGALGEGAASLLADGVARPANVWRIDLDGQGAVTAATVVRALVRNAARLDYPGVQADLDGGRADPVLGLLKTVGELRQAQERARGGVSLNLPEQEIVAEGSRWHLEFRTLAPVENWNAQISLLTGFCAAHLMRAHGIGVLRTLPPARQRDLDLLRHIAKTLALPWPSTMGYPDFVRTLDPGTPACEAMMNACTLLFRGAGYTVIGSERDTGDMPHGALASEYAHVTAPLRRLVDRYTGEICACLANGEPVPAWVEDALGGLPATMDASDGRAKAFERGVVSLVEALTLSGREGQSFRGVVVEVDSRDPRRGVVSVPQVAVEAPVRGSAPLALGVEIDVRLAHVDLDQGEVAFDIAGDQPPAATPRR